MKFCKNLQKIADLSDPEWAPYWTNYKLLKKLIKELPSVIPNTPDSGNDEEPTATTTASAAADFQRNPGEIAFFKLLHGEFQKATRFFDQAVAEFTIREERVREGLAIVQGSSDGTTTTTTTTTLTDDTKWSALAQSVVSLTKDLLLLETYAIMTYCAFSKILKKHDKVTGTTTRAPFMTHIVHKANFNNYPHLLTMIARCEAMQTHVIREQQRMQQEQQTVSNTGRMNNGMYEDERLFIQMIARLNAQALGSPDAPPDQRSRNAGAADTTAAVPLATTNVRGHADRGRMEQLRQLVEGQLEQNEDGSAAQRNDDEASSSSDVSESSQHHKRASSEPITAEDDSSPKRRRRNVTEDGS